MIQQIVIKNFKSFLDTKINLSALNLLTGINGVGKSTLIQVLLLVRQSYLKDVFPDKGLLLNGDLFNIGKGRDALNIHSEEPFIKFKISFKGGLELTATFDFDAESDLLRIDKNASNFNIDVFRHPLFSHGFKYLNSERVSPKVSYNVSLFEVEENRSLGVHGEHTSLFLAKYQREPISVLSLIHDGNDTNTLIEQVSSWLQDISPGVNITSQYFSDIDLAKINYRFEYKDSVTPDFRPTNVGFGITYVLPVITAILASKKGDLVIIENPESHLHPSGQAKLGELLFKAAIGGIQIIVETHSDHVLNGVRVALKHRQKYSSAVNIAFFQRRGLSNFHLTDIIKPKMDKNGRIDKWPEGFFDEWDRSLIQLI